MTHEAYFVESANTKIRLITRRALAFIDPIR